jgi:hypothetical protein
MRSDDIAAMVIGSWVLFAVVCSLFFLGLRYRLGQKNRLVGYPYAYYQRRKARLRRRYVIIMLTSILFAVTADAVLVFTNS